MLTGGRSRVSVAASMDAATLLDRAACAMAAVGSPAVHRALAEACSRPNKARSLSARSARAKAIGRTVSHDETLVKAALMRQQRAKKG